MTWFPDAAIRVELRRGEVLRWFGQPAPGALARAAVPVSLFGLVFTTISVASAITAARKVGAGEGSWLVSLISVAFIVIGACLSASAPTAVWWARRTVYAVTNERLIILHDGPRRRRIASFTPGQIQRIERRDRGDGRGDVLFRDDRVNDGDGGTALSPVGFIGIDDPVRVEAEVLRLVQEATADGRGAP